MSIEIRNVVWQALNEVCMVPLKVHVCDPMHSNSDFVDATTHLPRC